MFKGEQISGAWAMKVSFRRDHLYYDIKDKKELIIQRLGKRIPERKSKLLRHKQGGKE